MRDISGFAAGAAGAAARVSQAAAGTGVQVLRPPPADASWHAADSANTLAKTDDVMTFNMIYLQCSATNRL
jgi:hypothetical protein